MEGANHPQPNIFLNTDRISKKIRMPDQAVTDLNTGRFENLVVETRD